MKNLIFMLIAISIIACAKDKETTVDKGNDTNVISTIDSTIIVPRDTTKIDSAKLLQYSIQLATQQVNINLRGDTTTIIKNSDGSITKIIDYKQFSGPKNPGWKIIVYPNGKIDFTIFDDGGKDTIKLPSTLLNDGSIKGELIYESEVVLSIHLQPNNSLVMYQKGLVTNTTYNRDKDGNTLVTEGTSFSAMKWNIYYDDKTAIVSTTRNGSIETLTRQKVDGRKIVEFYKNDILISSTITYTDDRVEVVNH